MARGPGPRVTGLTRLEAPLCPAGRDQTVPKHSNRNHTESSGPDQPCPSDYDTGRADCNRFLRRCNGKARARPIRAARRSRAGAGAVPWRGAGRVSGEAGQPDFQSATDGSSSLRPLCPSCRSGGWWRVLDALRVRPRAPQERDERVRAALVRKATSPPTFGPSKWTRREKKRRKQARDMTGEWGPCGARSKVKWRAAKPQAACQAALRRRAALFCFLASAWSRRWRRTSTADSSGSSSPRRLPANFLARWAACSMKLPSR